MVVPVLLSVILAALVLLLVCLFSVIRRVNREVNILKAQLKDYFSSPGENQPSQFAIAVQSISKIAANEITASISGSLMGTASGISRAAKSAEGEVAVAAADQINPWIGLAMRLSPKLRKLASKNPEAVMALSQLNLPGMSKNNGHSNSEPTKFSL